MVTRLGEGVWWVDLLGVNAYLVDDGGALTLVDAGCPWSANTIAAAVTALGDTVGDIERVLITHYDLDHVGALGHLEPLDATVYIGRQDAPFLNRETLPSLSSQKGLFQRAVDWVRCSPDLPVELVDDGDSIGSFTAYHTPGHTSGHTVFASEPLAVAVLGDTVIESGGALKPAPWFLCRNEAQNRASVRHLQHRLEPFEIAAVGHGVPFVEGGDRRLEDCVRRLEGNHTPES